MTFSASEPEELFISHFEDHVVKVCPICTQEFPPEYDTFEMHVNMCLANNEQPQQQQTQMPADPQIVVVEPDMYV